MLARRRVSWFLVGSGLLLVAACSTPRRPSTPAALIDVTKVVDLSYSFGPDTIYWPTAKPFTMQRVSYGRTPQGYWYAANNICMAEHGGTHMDAPIHFAEGKRTTDEVPLSSCIGPAVVIDVRPQAAANRDYRLSASDIKRWEQAHGRIPSGAIVIMRSGWGRYWPDKVRYLGTDKPGDVTHLHFPGFSKGAATFLTTQRDIAGIGVDTASIDYGQSTDFIVHRIITGANKPGFENLANLDRVPATGATLIALPIKVAGGSGGPARVVAILP
ncbi:MAG: cyclase family protein [Candidatus Binatia bacterium]